MTVEAIARKAGPYDYTSGAAYPFAYKVFAKTDVYVVVTENDIESIITLDTDYTVTLNDDQDNNPGGYVNLLTQYGSDCKVTIGSDVPYNQGMTLTNKGGFYPDTLNKAYDKLTILCQQLLEQVSRCIKVNISSGMSADEYKSELEGLVDQSVSSAASAAASAQQAVTDSAKAVTDAATALSQSATALAQSGTALVQSTTALENSVSAVNSIQPALEAAQQASSDAAEAVEKSEQALAETAVIDEKVETAVIDAISGVTIPGLTPETIAGALGYIPYDAETNNKDFATSAEVGQAIQQAVDAIPEQVNADWNATSGVAEILNKPTAMTGATAETAGKQGFVPAPEAGDEEKVLTGSGEWKHVSGIAIGQEVMHYGSTPPPGCLVCDGSAVGRQTYPELYAVIGTIYGEGDGETTFNLPNKIDRFGQGSLTPGTVKEAGLPNLVGFSDTVGYSDTRFEPTGCFYPGEEWSAGTFNIVEKTSTAGANVIHFDASHGNPTYGKSDTVQPPALTLLPCIKAFDASVNPGLIDITELANDVAGKADKTQVPNLAMPIGAIYIQYADQADPTTLFGGTWENVSATYAGLFFRAEGGNAAAFGSTQTDGAPNITGTVGPGYSNGYGAMTGCFYGSGSEIGTGGDPHSGYFANINFLASNSNGTYGANEVRPINSTIRIWKRTA